MTDHERQVVDEIVAQSAGCPDAERLEAFDSNALDEETRRRIETHVSGCDACAAALRFLATKPEAEAAPEDVVRRSEEWIGEARSDPGERAGGLSRWPWVAAAAAAVFALLFFLPPGEQTGTPQLRTTAGQTVESLLSDDALPRNACRLQWTAGPEGSAYRLTVFTEDLKVLTTLEDLKTAEYVVPTDVLDQIDGDTFVWRVEVFSPDAEARVSGTFTAPLEEK